MGLVVFYPRQDSFYFRLRVFAVAIFSHSCLILLYIVQFTTINALRVYTSKQRYIDSDKLAKQWQITSASIRALLLHATKAARSSGKAP